MKIMKAQLSTVLLLMIAAVLITGTHGDSLLDSFKSALNFDWLNACSGGLEPAAKGCAEAQGAAFDPFQMRSYDQESCCQLHHFLYCTKDRVGRECSTSFAGKKFFEAVEKTMTEQCGRFVCNGALLPQVSGLLFGSLLISALSGYLFLA